MNERSGNSLNGKNGGAGSPLPLVLRPFGWVAAHCYGWGVRTRNRKFDAVQNRDPEVVTHLELPVISVGNLSAGGTGKTPMVQWICRLLQAEGHRPLIAMRGYKSREGKGGVRSDEQIEHEEGLAGKVPVIANPARAEAVSEFLQSAEGVAGDYDCCVLDDGFQHRQLARDLDLVLIDASRSPFTDRLLPSGYLREPVENLKRADAVILMGADLRDESRVDLLRIQIGKQHGQPPAAMFRHAWTGMQVFADGEEQGAVAVGELAKRRLVAVCAIGHPQRFFEQLELRGGLVVAKKALRDHAEYDERMLTGFIKQAVALGADAIVTTAKDWVKMRELRVVREARGELKFWRPTLAIDCLEGEEHLREIVLGAVRAECAAD